MTPDLCLPHEILFLCGSAAMRGGAVSGIPGRSAAMKVISTSGSGLRCPVFPKNNV
ncbi:MAG: hypothetical protein OSA84_08045 [Akkermansiaceae bacterium]|nr:hypothetical protein [Akkermansiaceae bacterium]